MQSAISHRSPWVVLPPPFVFVACFLGGTQIGRVLGVSLAGESAEAAKLAGACVAGLAFLLLVSAPALFALARTTIVPHGRARTLVTTGPYRFTRNPMYLGLAAIYVGAAFALNELAALPLLAIPLWVLSAKTIPYEEAMLERAFGDEYRAYARRVRRWL
jgi:protein-S-isoprenylcysteine O-methyltransferase Ste14